MAIWKFLKCFLITSGTILLSIIIAVFLSLLMLILSPIIIFRYFISKLAKCLKPNLGKILSARSAIMTLGSVYKNPKSTLVVACTIEGIPDINKARDLIELKLINAKYKLPTRVIEEDKLLYPELKQNLVYWMGFLFWSKLNKPFQIEDHVYYHHINKDNNILDSHREVSELVQQLTSKSWSKDKALWEIIIIPNTTIRLSESETKLVEPSVILIRFHHGLGDGYSIIKFLGCIDESGRLNEDLKPILVTNKKKSDLPIFKTLGVLLKAPYDLAKAGLQSPENDPWKLTGQRLKGHSCGTISTTIPLKEIKQCKNALGVSFTVFVTSVIIGGIRETINARGDKLPKKLSVRFPLPLDGHSRKLRNYATFGSILIDTREKCPLKRLQMVQKCYNDARRSTVPWTISCLCVFAGSLFPWVIEPLRNKTLKTQSVVISNIQGSSGHCDLFGHPLKDFYFTSSVAGTAAVVFAVTTYAGDLTISVGADCAVLPTNKYAEDLISNIYKQYETLKNSCNVNQV